MGEAVDFAGLVAIMDRLRGPDGCPWDREQDYGTLRGYLLEEAYEVAEALDSGDGAEICEELGDLLFQIVFLSRIAKEQERFTVDDVIQGISEKMIRRHPHVFGEESAENSQDVLRHWERIKKSEKAGKAGPSGGSAPSVLDGVPQALPALLKAQRLGTKAARVGFDWSRPADVLDKIDEELRELRDAIGASDRAATREELGDLLFSVAMLARKLDLDPEGALQRGNRKFVRRFQRLEAELNRRRVDPEAASIELLEELWVAAKSAD